MTRYTVVWLDSALDELTEIWLNSTNRESITEAVTSIDRILGSSSSQRGRELSEGLRALIVPPLRILFSVREDDRIVEVLQARESH